MQNIHGIPIRVIVDESIAVDGLFADTHPIDGLGLMYASGLVTVCGVVVLMWMLLPSVRIYVVGEPDTWARWQVKRVCADGVQGEAVVFRTDVWLRRM